MLSRYLILFVTVIGTIAAQSITGSITGRVNDSSGLAVLGADVKLVQHGTGAERQFKTGEQGTFVIGSLPPGGYDLFVSFQGFKQYEMSSITLSASETLAVPEIVLQIGHFRSR